MQIGCKKGELMTVKFFTSKRHPGVLYYISRTRRINGKPERCFYIQYRNSLNKINKEKIGWESEGISAVYASHIRAERIRKVRLGDEVVTMQQKRKSAVCFADFVKQKYLPYSKINKKLSSYTIEKQLLNLWIIPIIGNKAFGEITPLAIESVKSKMLNSGKASRTVEYAVAVIRQVFNTAISWHIFEGANPALGIKIHKEDNRRIRFLGKEESQLLLEECRKKSRKAYEVVLLALNTGMRAGEIAMLKWQDVDMDNKMFSIKDPKNRVNRTVYMTEKVYQMFKDKKQGNPDDYVFADKTGKKAKDIARTIGFRKIIKRLGFNDEVTDRRNKVVFHTLRHTFASWLAISGVPIYTIKELMGHKTIAMTERYAHLIPDTEREAIKNIDKMMSGKNEVK